MPLLPGFWTLTISQVKGCLSSFAVMGQVGVLVVGRFSGLGHELHYKVGSFLRFSLQ
jgi:hypothetical protein